MDTRRKIQFYINPDRNIADKYAGEVLENMPQGERGKFMRAAFLSGVAFFKQEPRLIYMLSELLTEKTTIEEITKVMETVLKNNIPDFDDDYVDVDVLNSVEDLRAFETRNNAKNLFGKLG
ncbi:plasmid partitioning/stability family protein [Candidatus Arsenophonus triatominarum]|uniref:plasmid partitioning/stability family protein n=1 Tax=Candidatus Arsenophonus triatominarum TaxID=57911 RepID=UPI0007C47145|nr:plasmid partitioning/stability family protein [Candidatus Arsenophonus triatominarum]